MYHILQQNFHQYKYCALHHTNNQKYEQKFVNKTKVNIFQVMLWE